MSGQDDSGDKTEEPTHKRLQDARKKGDIPKGKELTSTVLLMVWLILGALGLPWVATRLRALIDDIFVFMQQPFEQAMPAMGMASLEALLLITGVLLVPCVLIGILTEFLQAGPVFALEKVKPKMENMDPVAGVKRMFNLDQIMEVLKSAFKTCVLLFLGWIVLKSVLPTAILLMQAPPDNIGKAMWGVTLQLVGWTIGMFIFVSLLDYFWQRHRFMKRNRMSMRDIKQEYKEMEGNPEVKGQRRQLAHEWAQKGASNAAARASALVVNPTHVAIAICYDQSDYPVPTVTAKGEDDVALMMRQAAQEAGVPVVRNIQVARELLARVQEEEVVPEDMFDVIAEVILWAQDVRSRLNAEARGERMPDDDVQKLRTPPGEDLTRYRDMPPLMIQPTEMH